MWEEFEVWELVEIYVVAGRKEGEVAEFDVVYVVHVVEDIVVKT